MTHLRSDSHFVPCWSAKAKALLACNAISLASLWFWLSPSNAVKFEKRRTGEHHSGYHNVGIAWCLSFWRTLVAGWVSAEAALLTLMLTAGINPWWWFGPACISAVVPHTSRSPPAATVSLWQLWCRAPQWGGWIAFYGFSARTYLYWTKNMLFCTFLCLLQEVNYTPINMIRLKLKHTTYTFPSWALLPFDPHTLPPPLL